MCVCGVLRLPALPLQLLIPIFALPKQQFLVRQVLQVQWDFKEILDFKVLRALETLEFRDYREMLVLMGFRETLESKEAKALEIQEFKDYRG